MKTKYLEICRSDENDVKFMNVPPFEVWAIGEDLGGIPFSMPGGYFKKLDDAIQHCKDSGHAYKVHGSLLREDEMKKAEINKFKTLRSGNWEVNISKDHSYFRNHKTDDEAQSGILVFEKDTLVDFDGMVDIPSKVVEIVKAMGYSVDL